MLRGLAGLCRIFQRDAYVRLSSYFKPKENKVHLSISSGHGTDNHFPVQPLLACSCSLPLGPHETGIQPCVDTKGLRENAKLRTEDTVLLSCTTLHSYVSAIEPSNGNSLFRDLLQIENVL